MNLFKQCVLGAMLLTTQVMAYSDVLVVGGKIVDEHYTPPPSAMIRLPHQPNYTINFLSKSPYYLNRQICDKLPEVKPLAQERADYNWLLSLCRHLDDPALQALYFASFPKPAFIRLTGHFDQPLDLNKVPGFMQAVQETEKCNKIDAPAGVAMEVSMIKAYLKHGPYDNDPKDIDASTKEMAKYQPQIAQADACRAKVVQINYPVKLVSLVASRDGVQTAIKGCTLEAHISTENFENTLPLVVNVDKLVCKDFTLLGVNKYLSGDPQKPGPGITPKATKIDTEQSIYYYPLLWNRPIFKDNAA